MIKFCPKCETAHDPSRPCDPKGLKAVSARKQPVPDLGQGPDPLRVTTQPVVAKSRLTELTNLLTPEQRAVTKPAAELSTPWTVTPEDVAAMIAEPKIDISRGIPARAVTDSGGDPVMEAFTKRDDEVSARQEGISADQSSQPSQSFKDPERLVYMRLYMRAKPKAAAQGMSVGKYWKSIGYNWKDHVND